MAVDVNAVAKRVIELLLAAGRASRYTAVVGDNARYAVTQEILDAILEADANVCRAICETPGHPYAAAFVTPTGNLASGTIIPAYVGCPIDVTVDGEFSRLAESRAEILEILANPTLYPDVEAWHFIENSILYHTGTDGIVKHPAFTKTSACQAHESYQSADVAGAISLLPKDGGDDSFFDHWLKIYVGMEAQIRNRQLVISESEQYEKAA